jgi:predicted kinase
MIINFDNFLNEARVVNFDDKNNNFVVMMGSPGAGKSFTSSHMVNLHDYKYVNVDNFRVMTAKKLGLDISNPTDNEKILALTHTTSDPRNVTIRFLKNYLDIKGTMPEDELPNILFDAGGGQVEVIKTLLELAKKAGYTTTLIYVQTDLATALQRNQKRMRTLPDKMVVDYFKKVESAYEILAPLYDHVWEVYNNQPWDPKNRPTNKIIQIK